MSLLLCLLHIYDSELKSHPSDISRLKGLYTDLLFHLYGFCCDSQEYDRQDDYVEDKHNKSRRNLCKIFLVISSPIMNHLTKRQDEACYDTN